MKARQDTIRATLGVKNVWHVGPSPSWPLVLVVMDEAHTFLNESKGTDPESKRLDGIVRQTVRLVEELVRKGRNVGIQVVLATQKPTGDAIPTRIRDNCQVSLLFAQRTSEAAVAVLGADITEHPDEHPRRLVDTAYVGVASMVAQGRPGFTLVRTPYVPDAVADRIARRGAHLVRDPIELQTTMCTPLSLWRPSAVPLGGCGLTALWRELAAWCPIGTRGCPCVRITDTLVTTVETHTVANASSPRVVGARSAAGCSCTPKTSHKAPKNGNSGCRPRQ
jgi:hypothetical protein